MDTRRIWAVVLLLLFSGFRAETAGAQSDSEEWFDQSSQPERPTLRIVGNGGPYDPPPADFRSDERSGDFAPPATETAEAQDPDPNVDNDPEAQERALREFSPHLAPYGVWVDDPFYGRVWVPSRSAVGVGFTPYVTSGHWELTVNDEWLWVSDYPFGWITFHYGRWVSLPGARWAWVPGYTYAPAWVDFRVGTGGYIGWGPISPYYGWRSGVFVSLGVVRPLPFVYCPTAYVFSASVHHHVIRDRHRVRHIAAHTHRYRRDYARGWGPSAAEARIPARSLPARRTIAQPRAVPGTDSVRPAYRLDESRAGRRSFDARETRNFGSARDRDFGRDRSAAPHGWSSPERASAERRSAPMLRGSQLDRAQVPRSRAAPHQDFAVRPPRGTIQGSRGPMPGRSFDSRGVVRSPQRYAPAGRSRKVAPPAPQFAPQPSAPREKAPILRPGAFDGGAKAGRGEVRGAERQSTPKRSRGDARPARSERRTRSHDRGGSR